MVQSLGQFVWNVGADPLRLQMHPDKVYDGRSSERIPGGHPGDHSTDSSASAMHRVPENAKPQKNAGHSFDS